MKERFVVRLVPYAIDYIIVAVQLTIVGIYFYVAFIWEDFDTVSCVADINSDVPLSAGTSSKAVDVSYHFTVAIRWGFFMSLSSFIRAILAQVGLWLKQWVLLWFSYVLFAANIAVSLVLFILMQVWRWSHAGKVCSGELLPNLEDADRSVYLVFEGKFIKGMLFAVYSILGISLISIMIVSICVIKRHREEDKLIAEQHVEGEAQVKRSSAFNKALDPDYESAMLLSSRNKSER